MVYICAWKGPYALHLVSRSVPIQFQRCPWNRSNVRWAVRIIMTEQSPYNVKKSKLFSRRYIYIYCPNAMHGKFGLLIYICAWEGPYALHTVSRSVPIQFQLCPWNRSNRIRIIMTEQSPYNVKKSNLFQDGIYIIYALGKAHMRSTPSLSSHTVPMLPLKPFQCPMSSTNNYDKTVALQCEKVKSVTHWFKKKK